MWLMPFVPKPPNQIWTQYDIRQSEFLMHHCCCHGNLVTIAMRYVADALSSQRTSISNTDSIRHKTKELLMYHCGCHSNLVTIATRYVADAILPIAFKSENVHFFNSNIDLKIDLQRT